MARSVRGKRDSGASLNETLKGNLKKLNNDHACYGNKKIPSNKNLMLGWNENTLH